MAKPGMHKKASKRTPLRTKYKIQRKVKQHLKKTKKENRGKSKLQKRRKDPGIPNDCPFKEDILTSVKLQRDQNEAEKQTRKDKIRLENKLRSKGKRLDAVNKLRNIDGLGTKDPGRLKNLGVTVSGNVDVEADPHIADASSSTRRAFFKHVKKVIEASDVVLEVLDARDPDGCRCKSVEDMIISDSTKRLVLVLNKVDLVPGEVVEKWLKHLRQTFPVVAFKASTQEQRSRLGHSSSKGKHAGLSSVVPKSSTCFGASNLLRLLGNYTRNRGIRGSVTVGLIGFPNTGKSSLINSLKRSRVCGVGAAPGVTTVSQRVKLDKHVTLLDSPGVIVTSGSRSQLLLKNCISVDDVADPLAAVDEVIKRCGAAQLMALYKLPEFSDASEFAEALARRRGCFKKGGVLDTDRAARQLLRDWVSGCLRYYCDPPSTPELLSSSDVTLVSKWRDEFDLDSLLKVEGKELRGVTALNDGLVVPTDGPSEDIPELVAIDDNEVEDVDAEDVEMVDADCKIRKINLVSKSKKKLSQTDYIRPKVRTTGANLQLNKARKLEAKKLSKKKKKFEKLENNLPELISDGLKFM